MELYDQIQELRAELSRCDDMAEIVQIEAELREVEAQHAKLEDAFAAWFAALK